MPQYANTTSVSSEASRAEIERTLRRYGADGFAYAAKAGMAMIGFTYRGKQVRFLLPLPDIHADEYRFTPARKTERSEKAPYDAWEQACRQRWRALAMVVKAKLEAVECGISEFGDEVLAHIVRPNGETGGQWMRPQLEQAYAGDTMPPLLAGF